MLLCIRIELGSLTILPPEKHVGFQWVYALKYLPDEEVELLKAWLVAKEYMDI